MLIGYDNHGCNSSFFICFYILLSLKGIITTVSGRVLIFAATLPVRQRLSFCFCPFSLIVSTLWI